MLSLLAVLRITAHPALLLVRAGALVALAFSAALAIEYYGPGATFCASDGGCADVRAWAMSGPLGTLLPAVGLLAYTIVFAASLVRAPVVNRLAAGLAIVGGLGALAFLGLQGAVIGHWCKLCVGVDTSALLAAAGGGWLLAARPADERLGRGIVSPAWFFFWPLALGPFAWVISSPDPDVPAAIRELWDPAADVNVVEMADFECPYCRAMNPVLEEAIDRADADVHLARIIYPLSFHPHARNSARAYFCAIEQGQGEAMASALFEAEDISEAGNRASAEALGLDLEAYDTCVEAESTEARVEEDIARGDRAGMEGLPSVYIGEQTFRGFLPGSPPDEFVAAIEASAAGAGRRFRWWPGALIAALAFGSLALGLRRRRAQAQAPASGGPSDKSPDESPGETDETSEVRSPAPPAPKRRSKKAKK